MKPYKKLRDRIEDLDLNQKKLASLVGMSQTQLHQKLNGLYPFTQDQMYDIAAKLDIGLHEIMEYFPNRTAEQRAYKRKR